jgi:ligand-binding sensor domain-containing protein/signal transduction histidine kinase
MPVRRQLRVVFALALLTVAARPGLAIDPQSPASSYRRTTFTTEDGLGANVINDIMQTRDGFLWIATYAGLTRFDGQHFTQVSFPISATNVHSMAEGPDGDLWLGTRDGVFRISPRVLEQPGDPRVTVYHLGPPRDDTVWKVRFGRDGTLWAGTRRGLYRWNGGSDFSPVVGGFEVNRIEEAPDGHILIPHSKGYVEWDGARAVDHPEVAQQLGIKPDDPLFQVLHVFADRQGALWFSTSGGLFRELGGSVTNLGGRRKVADHMHQDASGNYWVAEDGGVSRVRGSVLETVATGVMCRVVFADRDGGLWIGTNGDGLLHIQDGPVHMFTTADGLRSHVVMAALTDGSGKLWVATNCGGIAWFDGERFHPLPDKDRRADCAYSLAEDDNGDLLVGTYGAGVFRLHDGVLTPYVKAPALLDGAVNGILSTHDGSLWIATTRGLTRLRDGQLRTYTTADGLSDSNVRYLLKDRAGTFWAATATGVDQLVEDRFSQVISRSVPVILGAYRGNLCIRFADGVSCLAGDKAPVALPPLGYPNAMIVASNDLWLAEHDGIVRLNRWEPDRGTPADYALFTRADGMRSAECTEAGMGPHMTITRDGRLWVTTEQGLAMIDLPRLPRDAGKPVVYVRDTVVGRKSQRPGDRLVLPPGTSHLELAFDPVELSAPQRIRMQYKLDGVDDTWLDAPPSHVATYSGLPPGSHTFHVRATNRDGVWDLVGMTYQVTQQPFVYQTAWFQALGVAAFLGMLGGLYWYRMRGIAHEFNVRLEERVTERTRIARDLHDTLLQSFQGVLLNFHAVTYLLSERPDARRAIETVVDQARDAITEGRNAVEGLRSAKHDCSNLEAAIGRFGQELAGQAHSPDFQVNVQGVAYGLAPLVANEVYHIATEALRNAFQHSQAPRIEVEIRYRPREFRLRVRDNGRGIDPQILQGSRTGHFGIPGMRERARLVGGSLTFWSKPDRGTEIDLTVPASLAYAKELAPPTLAAKIRRILSRSRYRVPPAISED